MKSKKGFILYDDYKESFELLNDKDTKELLFAIFDYHKNNVINDLSSTAKMAFMFIKNDLDRQLDNYNDICKRNQHNGLKGGRPRNDVLYSSTNKIIPDAITEGHFIYLIYDIINDEYKIGETKNLKQRRYDIKRPTNDLSIYDFAILPTFECQQMEKEIIKNYKDYRISGDWFKFGKDQVESIICEFTQKTQVVFKKPNISQKSQQDTNKIQTRYKQDIDTDIETNNTKEIYKEKFNEFWKLYPKRNGKKLNKAKALDLFNNLDENILDSVIDGAKRYSYQNNSPKDPDRFIKYEIWKECNKYHGEIMEQAKSIYLEYPKKLGGIEAINSICEAIGKVKYTKLLEFVKSFSQKQKQLGTEETYIKSAKKWFDEECWIDVEADEATKKKEF